MSKNEVMLINRKPRSNCPIANALDLVGDKWTLLLVRDMLRGKSKYGEFAASGEGIPTNILAARLKNLEESGLVSKEPYSERPPRYEYVLTPKGRQLGDLVRFVRDWGSKHIRIAEKEKASKLHSP